MSTESSQRQREYIETLLSMRLATLGCTLAEACERLHVKDLTKAEASTVIERLLGMPADPDPTVPAVVAQAVKHGVNGSPGACASCKHTVERGAGFYFGVTGSWQVHHKVGECSTAPAPAPVTAADVEPGIYLTDAGEVVKLYVTGSGHLGGKMLTSDGRYVYQRGLVMVIRNRVAAGTAHLMTAAEAASFGAEHSYCVNCGEALSDPRSDPLKGGAGYGPVCAKRNGWPWGQVKVVTP